MRDKDELKRLRSEEIQSVEVITNPGAEYDATISAVVRIKTVRREGAGFGFDLMAANNQDLAFGFSDPSSTLNLRYRRNNLDLFGMVNYWSCGRGIVLTTCILRNPHSSGPMKASGIFFRTATCVTTGMERV